MKALATFGTHSAALLLALSLTAAACADDEPTAPTTSGTPDATVSVPDGTSGTPDAAAGPDADATPTDPPLGPVPPGGKCDYVAIDQGGGGAYGEACTNNADCLWGECLQTFEGGNLTNQVFGFCTRGCDCGTTETQLTTDEKEVLMCIYPPGNQRKWAHVVVRCNSLADCQALDPRWTDCRLPSAGGVQAVCHADAE